MAKSSFDLPKVTGTISRITVSGDGKNLDSAEMSVEFNATDAKAPEALRVGAGMAPQAFAAMCSLLQQAYQFDLVVTISARTVENSDPVITSVALPDKAQPKPSKR